MRVIVFFDLPTETIDDRREYRRFRKFLVKKGFVMMQESVYSKIALNQANANLVVNALKQNKPQSGLVSVLTITEKQYEHIECIVGDLISEVVNSDERLIVI